MWGIIVALISGALMSVQGVFNTGVTKQTSTWLASAWVAFSGFVVAIALWAIFERNQAGIFSLAQVDHKYMPLLHGPSLQRWQDWDRRRQCC